MLTVWHGGWWQALRAVVVYLVRSGRCCTTRRGHVHASSARSTSLGRQTSLFVRRRRQHRVVLRPTTRCRRQHRHRLTQVSSTSTSHLLIIDALLSAGNFSHSGIGSQIMAAAWNWLVAFLSRVSILLLTRDIDIVILSVRPSVCPSVTRWYCMKTAQQIVIVFPPYSSPIIPVLRASNTFTKFRRGHPLRGR